MGFFDYYEPIGSYACPVCATPQLEWQGKDGPCGLFLFREGSPGAVEQRVDDDCRLPFDQISAQRLPDEFFIHAHDCDCPFSTELRCFLSDGVWQRSDLLTGSAADLQQRWPERREQWQARRHWLKARKP
jgi:hypothetical protein